VIYLIEVSDTGIGIPQDKHKLVFSKFSQADDSTTRKYGGTGLGLAITKQIVDLLGGQIGFESAFGKGSKFWVRLKLSIEGAVCSIKENFKYQLSTNINIMNYTGKKVLLVEDNSVNQMVAQTILEKYSLIVTTAENGLEVIKLYQENDFDLVFMDCQMPEMDGYQATGKIREYCENNNVSRVPIVALTANAMEGDREKCLNAGMDDYLSKPVTQKAIENMLVKWLKPNLA
jgi:CheY-like chemotaxis protein